MRGMDLDTGGLVWEYRPEPAQERMHKGQGRVIPIGPSGSR